MAETKPAKTEKEKIRLVCKRDITFKWLLRFYLCTLLQVLTDKNFLSFSVIKKSDTVLLLLS